MSQPSPVLDFDLRCYAAVWVDRHSALRCCCARYNRRRPSLVVISGRCDRNRAVMEPRVLRSYSLNVASVEVRPLPNAQSVATPGPNPRALEVGARRLVWPTRTRGRWHSCTHPLFVFSVGVACRLRHVASPPSQLMS